MPYLSLPSRRQFLATAAAGALPLRAAEDEVRWAFLSDTHISEDEANKHRGFRPYENLKKVVPQVLAANAQGALIDGDLARLEGRTGDYWKLKSLLDPLTAKIPVGFALGNHDHRKNFLVAFDAHAGKREYVKNKYVLVIEAGPVRFLMLDTLMRANFTPGFLGQAQRTWLETFLQIAPARPTLVFVHHTLGQGDNDLLDVDRLFRILAPNPVVKAVVYGHSHVYNFRERDGIHLINIPAVGYNFAPHAPVGWVEAKLGNRGAEFTLHAIGGNTEKDGTTISIEWRG